MSFKPKINLRPTNMLKAFFLNALLIGIVSALTIEVRRILDENQYTKMLPDRPHKVMITATVSTFLGFIAYLLSRWIFGLGGGMLAPQRPYPTFL